MQNNRYNNFGLPGNEKAHINCTEQALLSVEFKIYKSMTKSVAEWFYNKHVKNGNLPEVKFINYGDTELVYLLTYGDKRYTMLFGQPIVKEGGIIREYELLKKYYYQDKSTVVAPIEYYKISQAYFNKKRIGLKSLRKRYILHHTLCKLGVLQVKKMALEFMFLSQNIILKSFPRKNAR